MRAAPVLRSWRQLRQCSAASGRAGAEAAAATEGGSRTADAAGAEASDAGGQELAVKAAQKIVFDAAAGERAKPPVVVDADEWDRAMMPQQEGKWERKQFLTADSLWRDWEQMDKEKTPAEILDLPPFASGVTVYLRWKVAELRTREDRFFKVSDLITTHLNRRRRTYRNAYKTMRQAIRFDPERQKHPLVALPSKGTLRQMSFPPFVYFVHGRMKRDVLCVYAEDSLIRVAKQRNWSRRNKAAKEPWRYDEYYMTRNELRLLALKNYTGVLVHAVRVPIVFLLWRGVLLTLEHASLGIDYLRVYLRGGRASHSAAQFAQFKEDAEQYEMGESTAQLRSKVYATREQNPYAFLVLVGIVGLGIVQMYVFMMHTRLLDMFLPERERSEFIGLDFYREREKRLEKSEKKLGWFERPPAPVVPEEPKPDFSGMRNI